jgi:hypothetical protein
VRFIVVRELGDNAAILTLLIPAKPAVRNGLRAQILKATENGILFGNLERLA